MLFEMMASAVSEDASKASVPAAYPAREGMVTDENSPYGEAANASIAGAMPPGHLADHRRHHQRDPAHPGRGRPGNISVEDGMAQMQAAGEAVAG